MRKKRGNYEEKKKNKKLDEFLKNGKENIPKKSVRRDIP